MDQKILSTALSVSVTTTITCSVPPIVKKLADEMNEAPLDRYAIGYRITDLGDALQTIEFTFLAEPAHGSGSGGYSSSSSSGSHDSGGNLYTAIVQRVADAFQKEKATILALRMNTGT